MNNIDFQSLFEAVPGLYLILSPDLKIAAVSDAYLDATMTKRAEILGRGIFDVFPDNPDDPTATGESNLRASLNSVLRNKATDKMEIQKYDIRRPDGSFEERFWSPLNKPVLNSKNEIVYIIHRAEDVTEFIRIQTDKARQNLENENLQARVSEMQMDILKHATELEERNRELMETNRFLNSILENIPNMVFVKDAQELRFVRFNKAGEELLGFKREDLIGKNDYDFFPKDQADFFINKDKEVIRKGMLLDIEEEKINTANGERLLHTKKIPLTDKGGKMRFLLGISEDITERKKSEADLKKLNSELEKKVAERTKQVYKNEKLFRSIVINIPKSLVIVVDREHRFIMIEGDIMERMGYKRQDYEGKHPLEVSPKEQYEASRHLYDRVFNGELFSIERSSPAGDFIAHFVPIKNDEGVVESALIIALDISEIKKAQNEISELNHNLEKKVLERTAQLESVNKELEAFSYSVSHDLRAPLRSIDGYSKMLEEDYGNLFDDEGKRLLRTIQYNATKMGTLIDDLLSFSRLGKKDLQKSEVNMDELLEGTMHDLGKEVKHNAQIVIHKLHPAISDYGLMSHVMYNLVSNAIKYSSKKEEPRIEIKSERKDSEVIYSVSDNGVGFDMKYAPKLFGVFQRLHSADEFDGTGVGLAIVQRIINKHGGKIWVDAKKNQGATFYFSLPLN